MVLCVLSIQHDRQGLSEVERISAQAQDLEATLADLSVVNGAIVLATCNRFAVILDAETDSDHVIGGVNRLFDVPPHWDWWTGEAAVTHLFRVASGLESMVVGEREIAGQLRRAMISAQEAGHTSLPLTIVVEEALKTSRLVANTTSLESAGRTIVGEGLDLLGVEDWTGARVFLLGTGSYAGAVIAGLRRRGVSHITVHSVSGRAQDFAASHQVECAEHMEPAMSSADVVITCRGRGAILNGSHFRPGHRVLDLSVIRDVDPAAQQRQDITVIDLHRIQRAVVPRFDAETQQAKTLIAAGVNKTLAKLRTRIVDPAVALLRETVMDLVSDEMNRLPDRPLTREDTAHALRRLATRMLHVPSARARVAAEEGRAEQYLAAMRELYDISTAPNPDNLDSGVCPVTHARMDDLDARNEEVS